MSQEVLNRLEGSTRRDEVAGEGMPEIVPTYARDARKVADLPQMLPSRVVPDVSAIEREDEGIARSVARSQRGEFLGGILREWNDATT